MKQKEWIHELRALGIEGLTEKANSLAEELMKLRFRKASGQLEQTQRIAETRKKLAQVQSVLAEEKRKLSAGGAPGAKA
jgi:ribosomal protein L29